MLPRHKTPNVQGRKQKHNHECPYVFMRRRGAWACPNAPSSQDTECTRKGTRTQTRMLIHLYEKESCIGKPETLPRHKMAERTKKTKKHTRMLVRLYEEERCKDNLETLPRHKTAEGTTRCGREHTREETPKKYTQFFSLCKAWGHNNGTWARL